MKSARVLIACFTFFLLQMIVAPKISFGEIGPDFILLLVAYFAINRPPVSRIALMCRGATKPAAPIRANLNDILSAYFLDDRHV